MANRIEKILNLFGSHLNLNLLPFLKSSEKRKKFVKGEIIVRLEGTRSEKKI